MGVVIVGFPGVGKTTSAEDRDDTIDLDLALFTKPDGEGNRTVDIDNAIPEYIKAINKARKKYRYVLVSVQDKLYDAMDDDDIPYLIVMVTSNVLLKGAYLKRYKERGDTSKFIERVRSNYKRCFDSAIKRHHSTVIIMDERTNMEDVLRLIDDGRISVYDTHKDIVLRDGDISDT